MLAYKYLNVLHAACRMPLDMRHFSAFERSLRYKYVMHVSLVLRFDLTALIYGAGEAPRSAGKRPEVCHGMEGHKKERALA